jgi:drug/metabolite transporter (DMT)-like permease
VCGTIGVQLTSAADAAMFQPCAAIITMLLSFALKREVRSWQKIVACLLTVAGALSIVLAESLFHASSASARALSTAQRFGGVCLFLANTTFVALYITVQKPVLNRLSVTVVTTYSFLLATPFVYVIALFSVADVQWSELPPVAVGGFFYVGILGTGVVFVMFSYANKVLGSTVTSMSQSIQPAVRTQRASL